MQTCRVDTHFKNHPLPHPPPDRSLCSLTLPLYQIHSYTTGTDVHVAKRHKGQPHPLHVDRQVQKWGRGSRGLVYAATHSLPCIMTFNVQKCNFERFFKHLPTESGKGEGENTPTPSPRSLCSLALLPVQKYWLHHWH